MENHSIFSLPKKQLIRDLIEAWTGPEPIQKFIKVECRKQGWGEPVLGHSLLKKDFCLAGRSFDHGIGTHADSELVVKSEVPLKRFRALAGVDDHDESRKYIHQVIFSVEAGGKELWRSRAQSVGSEPAVVDVDLHGAREFVLKAWEVNRLYDWAHLDWADTRIVLEDGTDHAIWSDARYMLDIPPVSFQYGGQPSFALLDKWKKTYHSQSAVDDTLLHTLCYADPKSGLECRIEMTEYSDFPALEWVVHFRNGGVGDTPALEAVNPLDTSLPILAADQVVLHRILGCTSTVSDFAPCEEDLYPGYGRTIGSIGGRSSNGNFPFFNVAVGEDTFGLILAIGWTGQWRVEFRRDYHCPEKLTVQAGMEDTCLILHAGEEIRTPRVLVFPWSGNRQAAHNRFRQFILRHHTPRLGGALPELPIAASSFNQCNVGNEVTEENQIAFARNYVDHDLGIECWWVDAGWFEGGWPHGVGNWFPKKQAFPHGLRPLADAVHAMGLKFLVWFEPERVAEGSWLHREHPEWLLSSPPGKPVYCPDGSGPKNHLLNLGNPEARKWLTDYVADFIAASGIDIYRHDANIDPLDFWPGADRPDRRGMTEIRYIEGLYDYWEGLKARNPGLLVECCCSGNRRFDLESVSRCINLYRSDYIFHPIGDQCQVHGLNLFLPIHANGCNKIDPYVFRGVLGTSMVIEWGVHKPGFDCDQARRNIALFKRVRPYFHGDYYPLTPYSTRSDVWCAYQFHQEDINEGVVLAFRRTACPQANYTVRPGGLRDQIEYEVEDMDTGCRTFHTGKDLAAGLRLDAERTPASIALIYRPRG